MEGPAVDPGAPSFSRSSREGGDVESLEALFVHPRKLLPDFPCVTADEPTVARIRSGQFLHQVVLNSCRRHGPKTALVDASCGRRLTFAEYGEAVERLARGLISAGLQPGDVLAIFLPNSWEFCITFHAAQLAGAIPTLLNPTYREREVRYQLENSGAVMLITDGCNLEGISLAGLPHLRRVYTTRQPAPGTEPFASLMGLSTAIYPTPDKSSGKCCRPALLQRHHGIAQGRHALAFQPARQRLSISRTERYRLTFYRHDPCAACRYITSTV